MIAHNTPATTIPRVCPKCKHSNRIGILFCEKCGAPVATGVLNMAAATRTMVEGEKALMLRKSGSGMLSSLSDMSRGMAFQPGMMLRLKVEETGEVMELCPSYGKTIVLGRSDASASYNPEIDLLPYGGYSKGISRRHASLMMINRRIQLVDLGSSNGTFVAEKRLSPRMPIELRDGDTIRLGSLTIRVEFKG